MQVLGKNGLGNFLKILLQMAFITGILLLILFPTVLRMTNLPINPNIIAFYPNAICLLLIMYQFIGLFDSLKVSNPFCENTIKKLNRASKIAVVNAFFWLIDSLYEMILVRKNSVFFIVVLVFMFILFIGVAIALYILGELFSKALEYKKENELTI